MDLFFRKKTAPAPKLSDSIAQLREAQIMLDKREKHLNAQLQDCRQQAKEKLRHGDKRGAMAILKRSKLIDNQVNLIYGKRANLDVQIMTSEGAASNHEFFNVMKQSKISLEAEMKKTKLDDVENLMLDISETISDSNVINEAMSQPIGPPIDEDELQSELDQMQQEMADEEYHASPQIPATPVVQSSPTTITYNHPTKTETVAPVLPNRPIAITAPKSNKLDEREARELKDLEALMGS